MEAALQGGFFVFRLRPAWATCMTRIVYCLIETQAPRGGHKVSLRHVETLNELGFDAVARLAADRPLPSWIEHRASIESGGELRDDDVIVLPEDATALLKHYARAPQRKVVFCQNHFSAAAQGLALLTRDEAAAYRDYMACSRTVALWLSRFMGHDGVQVVPAFADERRFRPTDKELAIACTPGKRPFEFAAIRTMVSRLYPGPNRWRWDAHQSVSEAEIAQSFGRASLFLSLSRLEGLGMTTLEAMASGCVPIGFAGVGGREYATPTNGFWVDEDDLENCAAALVRAMALVDLQSAAIAQLRAAAEDTAARYSHAAFVVALRDFWSTRV